MSDVTSVSIAATGAPKRVGLLQTTAKAFGTFVSPTSGSILYVDPKHDDEKHHSPVLDRAEAKEAFMRGLIEDPADAPAVTEAEGFVVVGDALEHVATERTAEFAEADAAGTQQPSALDSRSSTAWPDNERVAGGAEGFTDGIRVDDHDDDAPPAPAPAARANKTKADPAK